MSDLPRLADPIEARPPERRSILERVLGVVTEVRASEGVTALLLTLNVFLLLTAYYVIKPVREALIGSVKNGPEYKSYMGAVIAVALLGIVPLYSLLASRLDRNALIQRVSFFFVSNLVVFWLVGRTALVDAETGALIFALAFVFWVGIFNLMIVAQFWAFAADVYTTEQGTRLFPLVGLGASVGSVVGSLVVNRIVKQLGTEHMMLVAAVLLGAATLLTAVVHRREIARRARPTVAVRSGRGEAEATNVKEPPKAEPDEKGSFALVLGNKYLRYIAIFTVLFSLVNTSGEFIVSKLVSEASKVAAETKEGQKAFIAAYYGDFFLWVNVAGVVIQSFLVSRIVKFGGLTLGLLMFPVASLMSELSIAIVPILIVARIGKTAENSLDYSLNNTMRNMLWLPTSARVKYVAKQAIDSFFARLGDVGSALVVFVLVDQLDLGVRAVAIVNVVLVAIWVYVAIAIVRENKILTRAVESATVPPDSSADAEEPPVDAPGALAKPVT